MSPRVPTSRQFRHRSLRTALIVVLAGSALDCECVEHPLYDHVENRFHGFYMGGGNTAFPPTRRNMETTEIDVLLENEPSTARPTLRASASSLGTRGWLLGSRGTIAEFDTVADGSLSLQLPVRDACASARRNALSVWLEDPNGGRLNVPISLLTLSAALESLGHKCETA